MAALRAVLTPEADDFKERVYYDLPDDAEDYVHRIGRTARAGAEGDAISFVCETYAFSFPDIEKYIGHRIAVETIDKELLAAVDPKSRVRIQKGDRLERRDGRGGGPRRGKPGGGKPRSARPAEEKGSAESAATDKPRRRRRRRKPNTDGTAPA